jgi:DNA-binding HxlR family transcriptional regulator
MKRTSFQAMQCPVARTLEHVGEWWSILILRDAMYGSTKFDEFREGLGISPTILSRRLKQLVSSGFLERKIDSGPPLRVDYVPTAIGRAFEPVLLYLHAFGNQHFSPEGEAAVVVHRETGKPADLKIVDRKTGQEVTWPKYVVAPGPVAHERMKAKLAGAQEILTGKAASKHDRARKAAPDRRPQTPDGVNRVHPGGARRDRKRPRSERGKPRQRAVKE